MNPLPPHQYEAVARVVCGHFHVSLREMKSRSREETIVRCRHIIWYLLHRILDATWSGIARCAKRDHGAIMNGVKVVDGFVSSYPQFAREVAFLENRCRVLLEVEAKP